MSKAAKQSIFILITLLAVSLGYGGYTLMEKQKLQEAKAHLEGQLEQAGNREKKNLIQINNLKDDNTQLNSKLQTEISTSGSLRDKVASLEREMEAVENELNRKITRINSEKDSLQRRVDRITVERDDLLAKLKERPKPEIEEKKEPEIIRASRTSQYDSDRAGDSGIDEEYWAEILRQKAKLEVEVEKLKDKMDEDSLQIVDLKQKNQQLELKLDALESEKELIESTIRDKEELANRLSLELARAKNDRKFEETQVGKLKKENLDLRRQLRDLVSSKNSLEKSIIRLTQDKVKMEKKLGQTETIIQSKIDEIWDIKDSIDESFKHSKVDTATNDEVELPPIVVKSDSQAHHFAPGMDKAGFSGKVVSVNNENNFVIVDIGEVQGLRLGDPLSVYRDSKYIARLEVIQVRKDIAAADVKDQWSKVRVGDIIR